MTIVRLSKNGFSVKGHCTVDESDEKGRLVCASVSSAVYLTANTIIEVIGDNPKITEKDGEFSLTLDTVSKSSEVVLMGFKIHLLQLVEQYPNCVKVISEV